MKNILIFNDDFFPLSETFIYQQIHGSATHFKLHLLANRFSNSDLFPLQNVMRVQIKAFHNPFDKYLTTFYRHFQTSPTSFSLQSAIFIKRYMKGNNIKIIHAHFGPNAIAILPIAKQMRIPLYVSFHGYDASKLLKDKDYMRALVNVFDYASEITIVSPHMYKTLNLRKWKQKVSLILYGINTELFMQQQLSKKKTIDILHSGRITPKKGVPDLIRSFSYVYPKHPHIRLHILGDGEELLLCETLVEQYKLTHIVTFYGSQTQIEVKKLMNFCDIFVLNSRTAENGDMEGLPNALLEAMSMGKTVLSTHHAGIPLAIKNSVNGILVPERDNHGLAGALTKLIENKSLRLRLGQQARKTAVEKFDATLMWDKINQLYHKLTN